MSPIDAHPDALQVLYEAPGLPAFDLPHELRDRYGGRLEFPSRRVYANFVTTLDGVVAIPGLDHSNRLISAGNATDRFLMGLLRATADVVLIGAGTLHAHPRTAWTPEHAYPGCGASFTELRRRRGRPPHPTLAVATASGALDLGHPALRADRVVLTTDRGAYALAGRVPPETEVVRLGSADVVEPAAAVAALHARGHDLVLTEGGPSVFGALLAAGVVDELFLTQSPLLAGRAQDSHRLGLVEAASLLPDSALRGELLGVRRNGSHLFATSSFATISASGSRCGVRNPHVTRGTCLPHRAPAWAAAGPPVPTAASAERLTGRLL